MNGQASWKKKSEWTGMWAGGRVAKGSSKNKNNRGKASGCVTNGGIAATCEAKVPLVAGARDATNSVRCP